MGFCNFWKNFFFPRRVDFLKMLTDQADITVEGVLALRRFIDDPSASNGGRVRELESQADDLRKELIDELNSAFVTSIDREDIFALSREVDDIVDYAQRTVEEMMVYRVKPTEHMKRIADVLVEGAREIALAVKGLQGDCEEALEHVVSAKKAENHIEHLYLEALADLFTLDDTIYILKMRELYRHLSNSSDRCDEAANVISDVVVKTT